MGVRAPPLVSALLFGVDLMARKGSTVPRPSVFGGSFSPRRRIDVHVGVLLSDPGAAAGFARLFLKRFPLVMRGKLGGRCVRPLVRQREGSCSFETGVAGSALRAGQERES